MSNNYGGTVGTYWQPMYNTMFSPWKTAESNKTVKTLKNVWRHCYDEAPYKISLMYDLDFLSYEGLNKTMFSMENGKKSAKMENLWKHIFCTNVYKRR